MATQAKLFTATVTAGTADTSPQTVALDVGMATVEKIRWRVPPGPNGQLGWRMAMGGVQVIPTGSGDWIVANDESDEWDMTGLPDEGEWQLIGYNNGNYDHSVYLWFYTSPVAPATAAPILSLFPSASLAG